MKENNGKIEENRGLIDKMTYEDKFVAFISFSFRALIFYSLSHTLGHLEFSWSTLGGVWHSWHLEQEGKERVGKRKRNPTTFGNPKGDFAFINNGSFSLLFHL